MSEKKETIGGQAVIEGVMMRSEKAMALAVRVPDGSINVTDLPGNSLGDKYRILKWPVIRGVANLVSMMSMGINITMLSAKQAYPEELGGEENGKGLGFGAGALAVILALGLFVLLPSVLTGLLSKAIPTPVLLNIAEGGVRLAIFFAYLLSVSLMKDLRRVFMYHGAEHMVVSCYESGKELSVEEAKTMPRLHPRCGTSYLLLVMVLSILLFSLLGWSGAWYTRVGLRLLMLPVVAGISYEILKIAGKGTSLFWRVVRFPGVQLQRLTTRIPTDDMLEVALAAFLRVLNPPADEESVQAVPAHSGVSAAQ